ncbi:MAG: dehydrogenase E1 component subunit alpha/beta [Acidimicrobiales bacterium]|jgi:2-oxoisovalerate dehydrogenase E1 component
MAGGDSKLTESTRTAFTAPSTPAERANGADQALATAITSPHGPPPGYRGFESSELIEDFRLACTSRALDDREITLQRQSRVHFEIAGAGHEALLLAMARSLRPGYDWFFPYYRDQALVLALGVTPRDILLQAVGSAADVSSGGRQMPAHWGNKALNIVTQSSCTGSQCLPAVGCAEAALYIARRNLSGCDGHGDELTYVSLGEGATSEGEFWESLNTACRLHLPVVYLVEDNGWAISVRASDQAPAPISELVQGYRGLAIYKVDGTDYFACRTLAAEATARVRAGEGPCLIHATVTRPYSHSSQDTQSKYRSLDEIEEEATRDPILRLERELTEGGVITGAESSRIREAVRVLVAEIGREVLEAPRPDPARVTDHVLALPAIEEPKLPTGFGAEDDAKPVGMGEAIRHVLFEQMKADERIRVFGEDVADADEDIIAMVEGKGGVFGTTHGLQREFGIARCYNAPLAEANIVGRGVGQAIRGLRPCAEIQFFDYIWPAMMQIRSEAATTRWRSEGRFTVPLVIRVAIGGYLTGGAIWHSQCGESIFTHTPGLIVVMPSRASDAAGLLRTAFRCEDPVLFLEHKHLLRQKYARDPITPPDYLIPLGSASTVRQGRDLTIVTWGATVQKSLEAAGQLDAEGMSVEVIDLRSLIPWDKEAVAASVARTSRLLVVHEDVLTSGFGAEVAAWVGEACFSDLDAPISRVGATDTFVAYEPTLERAILPQTDGIASAARKLLAY